MDLKYNVKDWKKDFCILMLLSAKSILNKFHIILNKNFFIYLYIWNCFVNNAAKFCSFRKRYSHNILPSLQSGTWGLTDNCDLQDDWVLISVQWCDAAYILWHFWKLQLMHLEVNKPRILNRQGICFTMSHIPSPHLFLLSYCLVQFEFSLETLIDRLS